MDKILFEDKLKELLFILATKDKNFNVLIAMSKALKKIILTEHSVCRNESSIHYLCKKLNNGKCLSIEKIFKDVKLLKNEKLEVVGNIPEEDVLTEDNKYFEEEFNIEMKKIKNNQNENSTKRNVEQEADKYIN